MFEKIDPLVTIMIPTYCQESMIIRAIKSALAQDYSNFEVIVADDASSDNTRLLVTQINDPRLRYYCNQTNLGRVANYWSTLYVLARGEWVVNLDGDDYYIDNTFISEAVKLFLQDPKILVVSAGCKTVTPTREIINRVPSLKLLNGIQVLENLTNSDYHFNHMTSLYHRQSAIDCGFYRLDLLSSDWESLYRLISFGKVAYLDKTVGVWNIHGTNDSLSTKWNELFGNLIIWDSIYDVAVQNGMDRNRAAKSKHNIIKFIAYQNLSAIFSRADYTSAVRYLNSVRMTNKKLFYSLLFNYKIIAKFILCLGYPDYLNKPL